MDGAVGRHGLGVAYDSPEAYDRAVHAALSFAAADTGWDEGCGISHAGGARR
jgi:hypothetical protein